ncbi:hypothetical protein JCM18909_3328 [Cutibacterium acnes JCM 18909]|nr:hypothetical protein JCM18909_3328 [Cutibacterium acnes JCM 18909]
MVDLVAKTYANYKTSKAINPPNQFLAWPGTRNRIIALPAALFGRGKWKRRFEMDR